MCEYRGVIDVVSIPELVSGRSKNTSPNNKQNWRFLLEIPHIYYRQHISVDCSVDQHRYRVEPDISHRVTCSSAHPHDAPRHL